MKFKKEKTNFFFFIPAIREMEKAAKHRAMDALLPDIQETKVSLGSTGWSPGELQGGTGPGHDIEEAEPTRREVL